MKPTPQEKQPLATGWRFINAIVPSCGKVMAAVAVIVGMVTTDRASAQTVVAADAATNSIYTDLNTGLNGGFGFGAWTVAGSSGGHYIQSGTPTPITTGKAWAIWLDNASNTNSARRSFNSPLAAGQTFFFARQINSLNGTNYASVQLQDASGNTLFNFWHKGGDNADGHYTDAATVNGTATGFAYNFQGWRSYSFKLTTSSNYVFRNITDNKTLTGTINGQVGQVLFLRQNGAASGGGADFRFDNFIITSDPVTFQSQAPVGFSTLRTNVNISVQALDGGNAVNTNTIVMKLDGNTVIPNITSVAGVTTISYTSGTPFASGSTHTAIVTLADSASTLFTNTWSFRAGYIDLPVALPGTYAVSNGLSLIPFTSAGDDWLGTNYGTGSSRTLYMRSTMTVLNNAGETGSGGFYNGYHFELGNQERLLVGNNWVSLNWGYSGGNSGAGDHDVNPVTTINLNEPHTLVTRIDFNPAGNDTVTIYFDPDFSQPELAQSSGIVTTFNGANQFDNIRLRCGNGNDAITVFSNVMVSATPVGVGFVVDAAPRFQSLIPLANSFDITTATPISAQVIPGALPITGVSLKIDGNSVSPTVTTSGGTTNVTYQPPSRLSSGVVHTAELVVTDSSNTTYTNTWSFTTGYDSLPLVLAGPITASNNVDVVTFTANNDVWIGTNYQSSSSRTLYARFTMDFDLYDIFGGLEFYQGNTERLLIGKTGGGGPNINTTWSLFNAGGSPSDTNVPPVTGIVTGEWHTFVVRADYSSGGNTSVKVWLDPDFNQTEQLQPNTPLTFTMNNTFDNIRLRAGNFAVANYTNIMIGSNATQVGFAAPTFPTFQSYVPVDGSITASANTPVGVTALYGNAGISSNAVTMTLDGNTVTPSFVKTLTSLAISYQPSTPLVAGSTHTAVVSLTDSNGTPASTTWSFTVDAYPSLPATYAGPISISGGGVGTTIFSSQNGWLANNTYANTNYSGVLWTKFSINVDNLDGETGGGGGFCGLHFYNGNTERLIVGNNWGSLNWSYDAANWGSGEFGGTLPFNEWHTIVVKTTYVPGNVDLVRIWLDPDLNATESGQVNPPTELLADVTFDSIHVRAGNNNAAASFSNIVISATSPFATTVPPSVLSINAGQLSWTSTGILQQAPAVTGPWADSANQSNPQTLSATNTAEFYRLRQ